jgi:hypothetical protein
MDSTGSHREVFTTTVQSVSLFEVVNAAGLLGSALFITISKLTNQYFECYDQPGEAPDTMIASFLFQLEFGRLSRELSSF